MENDTTAKSQTMSVDSFIEVFATIDKQESGAWGHYPFQAVAYNQEGHATVASLDLGGDVVSVYQTAGRLVGQGNVKLYLSCDFPPIMDILSDFVAIFTFDNGAISSFAIPYNPANGEVHDRLHGTLAMTAITEQFKKVAFSN